MATKSVKTGAFQYDSSAPTNPTMLNYPVDQYGLCSELRKAFVKMVSRLHGDQNKLAAAEQNLSLLIGHMYNRFAEQAASRSSGNKE